MKSLIVKTLSKSFDKKEIVKGISFDVEKGQLLTLLGPSGCGKTTTLRLVAGIETPDNGEIFIDNRLASRGRKLFVSQKERNIGMVFQDLALWPHMTVYENIEFGLKSNGVKRVERRRKVEEVLHIVNMQKYFRAYPAKISGGQKQLVAIARAIVTKPKLLLMDEPLSNIDIKLREEIRQEIKRIQKETNITAIYVTHDQEDAFLLSHKIAIIHDGNIEQIGSPEEIYLAPQSLFVAQFVGESNIIDVQVTGKDRILTPWGEITHPTNNRTHGVARIFFRPRQVRIEQDGPYEGVIVKRDFLGEQYRYYVTTSGVELLLYDGNTYTAGKPVRFSIKSMNIIPF
ncbi:MAG: ABC transporter ATP-binding protein [Candidatus Brocadiaceae bacterium]|nr:ABC transporter ATP-binding protein [Candidatus Brocadiaceae bacterium]